MMRAARHPIQIFLNRFQGLDFAENGKVLAPCSQNVVGRHSLRSVRVGSSRRSVGTYGADVERWEWDVTKSRETLERLAASLRPLMNFPEIEGNASFAIGELASHLGVSLRTLRFYEQSGLLLPTREGMRRVYSDEDRLRLEVIVALREFEVSMPGVKALMAAIDAGGPNLEDRCRAMFDQLLAQVVEANRLRIAELEGINGRIDRVRLPKAS
jgi:DNA-binding transcriptional MerR regulator